MTDTGTVLDGKYEILKEIGRGGMSVVYLAMDLHLNKQWAVKEIKKKGGKKGEIIVNSLLAEANLMKRLDHPALPRIVDIIDNGQTIYIVMDYIEGESLDKILDEYGVQSEELVISWAKQLCDALGYLHSQKPPIIYRDMKPGNVMLKPEGNIKIIDFGIAREYKEQNLSDTTVLGTRGYAPPEQYSGQTDQRSDIYALGMTMHQLLTGVDPRKGEVYAPVRQWNPKLSEGIELIIDKCTSPAPENRYQTCAELLYDLEHPDLITKGYKTKQKRRLGAFAAAAVIFIISLSGGITCRALASEINSNTYEELISLVDSPESYKQAIELYPGNTEAYLKLLETYENDGLFGPEQDAEFLALYNANRSSFDTSSTDYAYLNYKIGTMYFNYYTDDADGNYTLSTRVQKAYTFFAANFENEELTEYYEEQALSDCYYRICYFYKKYILSSSTVEEASKSDFEELLEDIDSAVSEISDAGAYDKLLLYNSAFVLIYDQRKTMASVGLDEELVLDLFDEICQRAEELEVQKEQSESLRSEITDNYSEYRKAIEITYDNTAQRSAVQSDEEG